MNREQHLTWSKQRALEYVERGELPNAWASMVSDMSKHEELENHGAIELGGMLLLAGYLNTEREMRHFINGFN
jgi:hypothetical protein